MTDRNRNFVQIIFNNIVGQEHSAFIPDHGFAAWLEFKGKRILFDAGGDSYILLHNMKQAGIDFRLLDSIVISHNHWDHIYGLPGVLARLKNQPLIFLPENSGLTVSEQYPSLRFEEVNTLREIFPGIFVVGPFIATYKNTRLYEQILVIVNEEDLILLVGCSHPGIEFITRRVMELFPGKRIKNIVGGYHLNNFNDNDLVSMSGKMKQMGIVNVSPSHCTGEKAIELFQQQWGNKFIQLYLGDMYPF